MKKPSFANHKYVPIPEWARKRAFFTVVLLFSALCMHAAKAYEEMQNLYRQYRDTPSEELYKTGHVFLKEEKLDEAMVCFTIVGNRYSPKMNSDEKRLCAYALNNAGGISQLRSSYSTAFSYYKKAMQVADEPLYQAYNNIAGIYLFYNDYQNASRYLSQAFDISLEQKNWESLSNALQNIIFLSWKTDSLAAPQPQIERYRTVDSIPHDPRYSYTINMADGTVAAAKGNYQEAIRIFSRLTNPEDTVQQFRENSYKPLYIAKCYMALHDYEQALRYLKVVEEETRRDESTYMLMYVYNLQMECYQQAGNTEGARKSKYDLMNLRDSINTAEELEKIKNIEFFHEVGKYEKQVVELNQQKNSRTLVAIISCIALVIVALLLGLAVFQNRRLTDSNHELYRKNDELVRQADIEKQQRAANKKKIDGFIERITVLQATIDKLQASAEEPVATQESPAKLGSFTHYATQESPVKLGSFTHYATQESPQSLEASPAKLGSFTHYDQTSNTLNDQSAIMEKVYQQLDDVDFICQPDLTVERLAQAIGIHDRYVSQVINESMNKNFNTLLNEYRIREACKRLTDFDNYGLMTNETIAEGLGYKSRSHFTRTFKKITGLTPSQYQKMAKEA